MIVDIPKVGPEGETFEGEEPAELLELADPDEVRPTGPIVYRLCAELVSGGLLVAGAVSVPLQVACARCGDFFSTTAGDSSFLRDYPLAEGQVEVDVTPDLREAILLEIPRFPLCRPDCAGLCPHCGKNRNREPCACPDRPADPGGPWSALEGLKL